MKVSEIANGSAVKIHAAIGEHSVVLMTEAIFGVSAGLLVRPMEYFGKYMQFLEPSNVEIRNKRDGRVYKFMATTITPVKTRYGYFHLIRSSSMLEPENSRRAQRFSIEKLGVMSINGDKVNLKNCIVYDISVRGMALILDNIVKIKVGDTLDVRFTYDSTLHNYEVSTVVVRQFTIDGKRAVGCSIPKPSVDLIGLLDSKKKQQNAPLDDTASGNLNPAISQKDQVRELEEDIAKEEPVESPRTITISGNPLDPAGLEHIKRTSIRQSRQEEKKARQAKEIENLLDLRDI